MILGKDHICCASLNMPEHLLDTHLQFETGAILWRWKSSSQLDGNLLADNTTASADEEKEDGDIISSKKCQGGCFSRLYMHLVHRAMMHSG